MLFKQTLNPKSLSLKPSFTFYTKNAIFSHHHHRRHHPTPYAYTQIQTYVDVYMKWKRDPYFDSIESIKYSIHLKPILALKNIFITSSSPQEDYSIPVSAVSKKSYELGTPFKVARFLRLYPAFFEEFTGPHYDLPWFKLTQKAIDLHNEERQVCEMFRDDLIDRLRRFVLMSCGVQKVLPFKIIRGMQWYLGFPDEFLNEPEKYLKGVFRVVEMEDGLKGLAIEENDGNERRVLSTLQRNFSRMRRGVDCGESMETLAFPLFPSQGLRLKTKIENWLDEFQKLPYISPYEDFSHLRADSDIAEKRVVGVLHELLSLFVDHSAERKMILSLRKYLGLPQKVHKAFERHPHIFYLSLKNRTCTAILKQAYKDKRTIEEHPLARVRKNYINLMKESEFILRSRRVNRPPTSKGDDLKVKDLDSTDDEEMEVFETSAY